MEIKKNRVMEVNDLISQFNNMDFDGDSLIALAIHSEQAKEDLKHMFVRNLITFEQADRLLIDYEHESIYAAYMLTYTAYNNQKDSGDIWLLEDIDDPDFKFMNKMINNIHKLNNGGLIIELDNKEKTKLTVAELMVNYALGVFMESSDPFYTFEKYGVLNKKNLNKLTYDFAKYLENHKIKYDFWDRIHTFNKFLLEISTRIDYCVPDFTLEDFVVKDQKINEFKEDLIQTEPFLAFHQNMILFEDYVKPKVEEKEDNILNKLFNSGARLKSVQLLKAASNTGIPTDIYGRAFPVNIKSSLLDGLTPKEYFQSGDSARLALQQRQDSIPKGGELQRKFFFVAGILKQALDVDDCFHETGRSKYYEVFIKNEKYLKILNHRWFLNPETATEELITPDRKDLIGKQIKLRSPITCQLDNYKICKKCLGEKRPKTENLGAPIGQYLAEAIVQMILRAHHFGGVFLVNLDSNVLDILRRSIVEKVEGDLTVISMETQEDVEYVKEYLESKYNELVQEGESLEDKILLNVFEKENRWFIEITVHELPFSEDAVKILKSITSLIDKNRSKKDIIPMEYIYDKLAEISIENDVFHVYFEMVMSLLFYCSDGKMYRYSETDEITQQRSLKDVIDFIDPKLNIFYNFSNSNIQKIFAEDEISSVDHMYKDLISFYK